MFFAYARHMNRMTSKWTCQNVKLIFQLTCHTHIPVFIQCLTNYLIMGGYIGLFGFLSSGKKTDIFRKSLRASCDSKH